MKRALPLLVLICVLGGCFVYLSYTQKKANKNLGELAITIEPRAWTHKESDLPPDEQLHFGSLSNGFRYILVKQSEPPERVSLRLHVAAGSLMEEEDQRGLAHFMEHMLFNGTKNYTSKELIPMMQRMGISFGAHANAYTSFDETVYMLDLPNHEKDTLNLGFTVMRDFADGALLLEEEIEAEREVILAEKTSRDSAHFRMMKKQFEALMPDFRVTHRFPIGEESVIKQVPRSRFLDFYQKYYRPEAMTFIAVGDLDLVELEEWVSSRFSTLAPVGVTLPSPEMGEIKREERLRVFAFSDKELPEESLSLTKIEAKKPKVDSKTQRAEILPLELAHEMLIRRFELIKKKANSVITRGEASKLNYFQELEIGNIEVAIAGGKWQEALEILNLEYRRAMQHGFTKSELEEAKAKLLQKLRRVVETREKTPSPELANLLINKLGNKRVLTSSELDLQLAEEACEKLTPENCQEAFQNYWKDEGLVLVATWRDKTANAEQEIKNLWEDYNKLQVSPLDEQQTKVFAYEDFGAKGKISKEWEEEDLQITHWILENGVRVNLKKTDFEKNTIYLLAKYGTGLLSMPKQAPELHRLAQVLMNNGGLGKHSLDDLEQITAGKTVDLSFSVGERAFELHGHTNKQDLTFQMQLMVAWLQDPGYRKEALEEYRKNLPEYYQVLEHDIKGAMQKMNEWLMGHDRRYTMASKEQALNYEIQDVRDWLEEQQKEGYLELSIVGDFDFGAIQEKVLNTFGALETRNESKNIEPSWAKISPFSQEDDLTFSYKSKVEKSAAVVAWPTIGMGAKTVGEVRRLNILSRIFDDRLRVKVREELGDSYSPSVNLRPNELDPEHGALLAFAITQPNKTKSLAQLMRQVGADMASNGITAEELERAKAPLLSSIKRQTRNNNYWLSRVLGNVQLEPKMLHWARTLFDDYASISKKEIEQYANKYLQEELGSTVYLLPESPEAGTPAKESSH